MQNICKWCDGELKPNETYLVERQFITNGLCSACADTLFRQDDSAALERFLDSIDSPVLLLRQESREVCNANKKACDVLGKNLSEMKGKRSGDVFGCVNSFGKAGCGKGKPCEKCNINKSLIETFATESSFEYLVTFLDIKKQRAVATYKVQWSTEKAGEHALLRIDRFEEKK